MTKSTCQENSQNMKQTNKPKTKLEMKMVTCRGVTGTPATLRNLF